LGVRRTTAGSKATGAGKADQAARLRDATEAVLSIHRERLSEAVRPNAPDPTLPDFREILRAAEQKELRDLSIFQRSLRKQARVRAHRAACLHASGLIVAARELKTEYQQLLDQKWSSLVDNAPGQVVEVLEAAFQAHHVPAAPLDVDGSDVAIAVLVPGIEAIPDRHSTTTASGNLSLKKMTKTMRNELYLEFVLGWAILAAREAFAIAPGLTRASLLVGRHMPGSSDTEFIATMTLARTGLAQSSRGASASAMVAGASSGLVMKTRGAAKDIQALDLDSTPRFDPTRTYRAFAQLTG